MSKDLRVGEAPDVQKISEDKQAWQAWFDGSASPNPGRMGLGVVLISPSGERHEVSKLLSHSGCNNEAELHALCILFELAAAHGADALIVFGDSDVAVRHANGNPSSSFARMESLIARARRLKESVGTVEVRWVPRHRNTDADTLSRKALGLPPSPTPRKGGDLSKKFAAQK